MRSAIVTAPAPYNSLTIPCHDSIDNIHDHILHSLARILPSTLLSHCTLNRSSPPKPTFSLACKTSPPKITPYSCKTNGLRDGDTISLSDDESRTTSPFYTFQLRVKVSGGKGGFGAQLRASGSRKNKTSTRESMKDSSGRRLRVVEQAEKMVRAIKNSQDAEGSSSGSAAARAAKKEALKKVIDAENVLEKFDDEEYLRDSEILISDLRKAMEDQSRAQKGEEEEEEEQDEDEHGDDVSVVDSEFDNPYYDHPYPDGEIFDDYYKEGAREARQASFAARRNKTTKVRKLRGWDDDDEDEDDEQEEAAQSSTGSKAVARAKQVGKGKAVAGPAL